MTTTLGYPRSDDVRRTSPDYRTQLVLTRESVERLRLAYPPEQVFERIRANLHEMQGIPFIRMTAPQLAKFDALWEAIYELTTTPSRMTGAQYATSA